MKGEVDLQTAAEMRQAYMTVPAVQPTDISHDYFHKITSEGLFFNPKIQPSVFQLRNGLPYTGMAARETVRGGEVLIRIP